MLNIDIRIIAFIFVLSLNGCGSSSTSSTSNNVNTGDTQNESNGVIQNKSGVWLGNIGNSDVTLIIDDQNNLFGNGLISTESPKKHFSYFGNIGEYSEYVGNITIQQRDNDYFSDSNSSFYGNPHEKITPSANLESIFEQTITGTINEESVVLNYSTTGSEVNLIGSWRAQFAYVSGIDRSGNSLVTRYIIEIQIDRNGQITGVASDQNGLNWNPPSGITTTNLSGNVVTTLLGTHTVIKMLLTFTSPFNSDLSWNYHGYAIQKNCQSINCTDRSMLVILKKEDDSSPLIFTLQDL